MNQRKLDTSLPTITPGQAHPSELAPELSPRSSPSRICRSGFTLRLSLSVLSGLFLIASFPKLDWNALVWVAAAPLIFALVTEPRPALGFLWAYVAGGIFLAGSCYWFVGVMETYGKLTLLLAVAVLLLFTLLFAALFGLFGWILTEVAGQSRGLALLLAPFLWVALELARTYFLTGFPWNLLGYAVRSEGLEQFAAVMAVYGLSFLAMAASTLIAAAALQPRRPRRWILLEFWIALLLVANWVLNPPPLAQGAHTALLVQPNIPLDESKLGLWTPWQNPSRLEQLVNLTVLTSRNVKSSAAPLLVWPEDPAPFFFDRDPIFRGAIETMAQKAGAYVVAGTVTFRGAGYDHPQNSAVVLDPQGKVLMQYDKIHLVPFGEYVPWWAFPGKVGKITSQVGDFVPGHTVGVARTPEGKIGVFICYEAIFSQLVRRLTRAGAQVLVNISNDAWYGNTSARFQHLEMARFRAIENRRYLLRSTNDGITAVVDPYGRLVAEAESHSRLVLVGRFDYETAETFYTRHGDVFAWACVLIAAALAGWGLIRRRIRAG